MHKPNTVILSGKYIVPVNQYLKIKIHIDKYIAFYLIKYTLVFLKNASK